MSDTWDGRPQDSGRDGWHWVERRGGNARIPLLWIAGDGNWRGEEHGTSSARSVGSRWRYLGPCLTPAEVEAREAAARREGIEAAAKAVVPFEYCPCGGPPCQTPPGHGCGRQDEIAAAIRALLEDGR